MSSECNKNNNRFVVGILHNTEVLEWDGKSPTANVVGTLFSAERDDPASIWDVARPSENGIFYGGTFHGVAFCSAPANSSVYRWHAKEKRLQLLFTGTVSTLGFATDMKRNMLYHDDTCERLVTGFQIDSNGDICKRMFMESVLKRKLNYIDFISGNGRVIFDFKSLGTI